MSTTVPTVKNDSAWSAKPVVQFYTQARQSLKELYASERRFLEPALEGCTSVLDIGCAAGGFFPMLRALRPGIRYLGIDTSSEMIRQARLSYPEAEFHVMDGSHLPLPESCFDLVLCTGVLHHNPNYSEMIQELYRVASKGCLLDLPRLTLHPYRFDLHTSYMVLQRQFGMEELTVREEETFIPYVLAHPRALFDLLLNLLRPSPQSVSVFGYYGTPSQATVLPVSSVCFCVVHLLKGRAGHEKTEVHLDLPQDVLQAIQPVQKACS